ncbi:hypothetical protein TWF679_002120 [Orbilia oligospora]|uniref:Uncharacterized protein n=1 Tax=Orbilia oligospora TaxID=2813651 RepID=A0A8H8UU19_ORBOL|nr:hypothetical protein TWF679_002120 [Orbilia oligospora]
MWPVGADWAMEEESKKRLKFGDVVPELTFEYKMLDVGKTGNELVEEDVKVTAQAEADSQPRNVTQTLKQTSKK